MKKMRIMSAVLLALSMSFVLTGCGSKNNESKSESQSVSETKSESQSAGENKSESKSESQSVSERETCTYECPGTGYGFELPEGVTIANGFLDTHDLGDVDYDSGVMMGWPVYRDIKEEDLDGMTEEEYKQKVHAAFSFSILCVKDVNSEEEAKEKVFALMEKMLGEVSEKDREVYSSFKPIHQENGYIWLMGMESRADTIREECKEEYNAFYDSTDKIISNMKFFTPEVWKGSEEGTAISFETIDLDGNPVKSETLFAQNKVTMINIWATTCGPCINELPELEEMNKEFRQKGGAIVGLLDDVWVSNMKYLDEAKEIVEDTGVTFTNLCAWDGYDTVLTAVGTPTTYFVDSQGRIIGEPILGANPAKYRERMEEYLAQAK